MGQKYNHIFRIFFIYGHKRFLVFSSNSIPGVNICLHMVTYRSFGLFTATEDLREIIILKLPPPWILEWKKHWLHKARELTCYSLFMLMILLLPLLLFSKKASSRPICVGASTDLEVKPYVLSICLYLSRTFFQLDLPGFGKYWQILKKKKNTSCKIINIAIPSPLWKLHANQILVSIRPIIIYKSH